MVGDSNILGEPKQAARPRREEILCLDEDTPEQ